MKWLWAAIGGLKDAEALWQDDVNLSGYKKQLTDINELGLLYMRGMVQEYRLVQNTF